MISTNMDENYRLDQSVLFQMNKGDSKVIMIKVVLD